MLPIEERSRIKAIMQQEIIPAVGCTEPISVSLCTAKAAEVLGGRPESIEVQLSANVLKNAMGVGIPGTGMTGLPIAIARGALVGRPENGLELLKEITPQDVEAGKRYIDEKRLSPDGDRGRGGHRTRRDHRRRYRPDHPQLGADRDKRDERDGPDRAGYTHQQGVTLVQLL